jgi:hypothetical protein
MHVHILRGNASRTHTRSIFAKAGLALSSMNSGCMRIFWALASCSNFRDPMGFSRSFCFVVGELRCAVATCIANDTVKICACSILNNVRINHHFTAASFRMHTLSCLSISGSLLCMGSLFKNSWCTQSCLP